MLPLPAAPLSPQRRPSPASSPETTPKHHPLSLHDPLSPPSLKGSPLSLSKMTTDSEEDTTTLDPPESTEPCWCFLEEGACMQGEACSLLHPLGREQLPLRARQSQLSRAIVERFPELMGAVGLGLRSKSFLE